MDNDTVDCKDPSLGTDTKMLGDLEPVMHASPVK